MIVLDKENKLITLHTKNTTYQMKVWDYNILLHTYYGPRLAGGDLSYLLRCKDRGFPPNPNEAGSDRTFSLDTFPQEYSTCSVGDFRLPSIELELPSGSRSADLRYVDSEVRKGKYALEGLPAFHGSDEEWETLSVTLTDAAAQVDVELLYGVLEQYDLITRSVRVINRGSEAVRLCRCASLCLDFIRSDLDMITFNGAHERERCPSRVHLHSGVQSADSVRGASSHQHNPFVILCDRNTDEDYGLCYGAMLLYSGNFRAAAEVDQFENSRLVMGINPCQFGWTLEPGAGFTAPEAALICSSSGFGQMSRQFHRSIRRNLIRDPWKDRRKPVLINHWEATMMHFDADKLAAIAKEAPELGIELFVMDDGWFGARSDDNAGLGDWVVNEEKLPGGLGALVPRIKELGMEFGIWIEPEMVNEDSNLYRAHPDWALNVPGRRDFPHMLIEGCCGGGRFDGGMLYYTPQIWCSDNTDAVERLRIQYGTSFCYPVSTMGAHVSAVPNACTGRITPMETRGVVAMHGTFGY